MTLLTIMTCLALWLQHQTGALQVGIGDHVPPRLSVLTFHNQVDPFASTSPSSCLVPDLYSLSTSRSLFVHLSSCNNVRMCSKLWLAYLNQIIYNFNCLVFDGASDVTILSTCKQNGKKKLTHQF